MRIVFLFIFTLLLSCQNNVEVETKSDDSQAKSAGLKSYSTSAKDQELCLTSEMRTVLVTLRDKGVKGVHDQSLIDLMNHSGWSTEELHAFLVKKYAVKVGGVANFLYNADVGPRFVDSHMDSNYDFVYAALDGASDGALTSFDILLGLPEDTCIKSPLPNCNGKLKGDQTLSVLSGFATLPACIQANQM